MFTTLDPKQRAFDIHISRLCINPQTKCKMNSKIILCFDTFLILYPENHRINSILFIENIFYLYSAELNIHHWFPPSRCFLFLFLYSWMSSQLPLCTPGKQTKIKHVMKILSLIMVMCCTECERLVRVEVTYILYT